MNKNLYRCLLLVLILFLPVCSKITGYFSYKTMFMDSYKKMYNNIEFREKEIINWLFKANSISGKKKLNIVLLKKEVIWIDILKTSETISENSPYIYGIIEKLDPGKYRIQISDQRKPVAKMDFIISKNNL